MKPSQPPVFASLSLHDADQRALDGLLDTLESHHHGAILGVLVYGSCLRSGDIFDGLLDLYLVCSRYRRAYSRAVPAIANWLLPPNVFHFQYASSERSLRCKVSVISLADFQHACSPGRFESYFWGRFAQPVALARVSDDRTRDTIADALQSASQTLLRRSLPVLPARGTVTDLWVDALQLSYTTELRTERPGRTRELVSAADDFYLNAAIRAAGTDTVASPLTVDLSVSPAEYRHTMPWRQRLRGRLAWATRGVLGKSLSIIRLVKALFTFQGGLDYIAWKLARHSGEPIEIPERVRRRPLIHAWGFFWGLYRRGIFK